MCARSLLTFSGEATATSSESFTRTSDTPALNRTDHVSLWYFSNMAAKAIQVSIDPDLLRRIDEDPEVGSK